MDEICEVRESAKSYLIYTWLLILIAVSLAITIFVPFLGEVSWFFVLGVVVLAFMCWIILAYKTNSYRALANPNMSVGGKIFKSTLTYIFAPISSVITLSRHIPDECKKIEDNVEE